MRILYFTAEGYPTFRVDLASLFGKYLPRLAVYSDIVTQSVVKSREDNPEWGGGNVHSINVSNSRWLHFKKFGWSLWKAFTVSRKSFDIIQVRDMPFVGFACLFAAKIRRVPFVYWCSYPYPEAQMQRAVSFKKELGYLVYWLLYMRGLVGRFFVRSVISRYADHIFVQSAQMKQEFCDFGCSPEKLTPVPMGVDTELIDLEGLEPLGSVFPSEVRTLVYLGTLDPSRQIEVLFNVVFMLKSKGYKVGLLVVGDTVIESHREFLRGKIVELGLQSDVYITGWVPIQMAWRYVKSAEIAYSPFPRGVLLDSASPTKVQEYLALGIPVICNDNPDQANIILATGAGLCVPYSAEYFYSATVDLLERDPNALASMASKGREYVLRERSYTVIAAQVAAAYSKLVRC